MDPTTTYRDLLAALADDDHDTARELAEALAAWLQRGGFWPADVPRRDVHACLARTLDRTLPLPGSSSPPLFELGRTVITPAALDELPPDDVQSALHRHVTGDWGDLDDEDRDANTAAVADGSRIFSVYHSAGGTKFWIITEGGGGNPASAHPRHSRAESCPREGGGGNPASALPVIPAQSLAIAKAKAGTQPSNNPSKPPPDNNSLATGMEGEIFLHPIPIPFQKNTTTNTAYSRARAFGVV